MIKKKTSSSGFKRYVISAKAFGRRKKKEEAPSPAPAPPVVQQPPPKPEIETDDTRSKLCEGRSSGIGFALLKPMGGNKFKAVQPISPCKDYMNDVLYSEVTGRPYGAWGLSTKKEGIFDSHCHVAMASCTSDRYKKEGLEKEIKLLDSNFDNFVKAMHAIDKMVGAEPTEFAKLDKNLFYAKLDMKWASSTWAISLWSILLRNALGCKAERDIVEEIETAFNNGLDSGYWGQVKNKLLHIAKHGFPKQDLSNKHSGIHDMGIISWKIPTTS